MAAQQELFASTGNPPPPAPERVDTSAAHEPEPAPVWLQRLSLVVLVLFCFYIGGLLTVLPWLNRYWDSNGWVLAHPTIAAILAHGWVRGIVSGLGLLDIWIGISELIHYRDFRP